MTTNAGEAEGKQQILKQQSTYSAFTQR